MSRKFRFSGAAIAATLFGTVLAIGSSNFSAQASPLIYAPCGGGTTINCYEVEIDGAPAPALLHVVIARGDSAQNPEYEVHLYDKTGVAGNNDFSSWDDLPGDQRGNGGGRRDLSRILTANSNIHISLIVTTPKIPQFSMVHGADTMITYTRQGTEVVIDITGHPAILALPDPSEKRVWNDPSTDYINKCGHIDVRDVVCEVNQATTEALTFFGRFRAYSTGQEAEQIEGLWISTNATFYQFPQMPEPERIVIPTGAPHLRVDGSQHYGLTRAYLPVALLEQWRIPFTEEDIAAYLSVKKIEDDVETILAPTITLDDGGALVELPQITFSAPTIELSRNEAAFTAVTPSRVMDTRDGTGAVAVGKVGNGKDDAGTVLAFDVLGKGGLPTTANSIGAVSLNVTAANTSVGSEGGWVAVYPCGTTPKVSNLNFISGQITPNAVITPISTDGKVCFKVYGKTDLIADINGYFAPNAGFTTVTPSRVMDTRDGTGAVAVGKVGNGKDDAGTVLAFDVLGKGGLPTTANSIGAVSLNVTAANTSVGSEGGWVAVYPCGTTPKVSNLNFISGQITPNAVITPISTDGKVCFKVYGKTDLIADINGYFPA